MPTTQSRPLLFLHLIPTSHSCPHNTISSSTPNLPQTTLKTAPKGCFWAFLACLAACCTPAEIF